MVQGAVLADAGHSVTCIDIDQSKISKLNEGEVGIFEPGLDSIVKSNLSEKRMAFTTDATAGMEDADVIFIAVGTPMDEDGSADLSHVIKVANTIGGYISQPVVVVNKSTVPVGSTKVVERELKRPDVAVVSNPEFLREGSAIHDFLNPDRIVVGSDNQEAAVRVAALYEKVGAPVVVTDPASAETIKYAANAFLATKISYINAVAAICEGVGADINDVVLGLGYDKRIGHEFLRPGPGWGGSCFPKDTKAMVKIAEDAGYDFGLLKGVITVNDQQYGRIVDKIRTAAGGSLKGKKIASWGLTFKALTDDLRDSPAVEIVKRLLADGAQVAVYDPTVSGAPKGLDAITVSLSPLDACAGADVLAVLTEWDEFRWISPVEVSTVMNGRQVVDARNLLDRSEWLRSGFEYQGIGR